MRGDFGESGVSQNALDFFSRVFVVFYLTPGLIFVNRLALPAKFRSLRVATTTWPGIHLSSKC